MKEFADLFQSIDQTNSTNEKVHLMQTFLKNKVQRLHRGLFTYLLDDALKN
jgi:hypothetical protein